MNNRIKRDLPDYGYDVAGPEYEMVEEQPRLGVADSPLASAYLEALLEDPVAAEALEQEEEELEEGSLPRGFDPDEALAIELIKEVEEEREAEEEEQEREMMLEYLYREELEREQLEQEAEEEALMQEYSKRSGWGGLGPGDEAEFQKILHNGEPGVFYPVKRQYLSLMPGMRKRSDVFYPDEDPRWSALIQAEIEKRNEEDMYERLYQLATALRGEDEYRK